MEKGMKIVLASILFLVLIGGYFQLTGNVFQEQMFQEQKGFTGPSESETACMMECTAQGCDVNDMECRKLNSAECGTKCGVDVTGAPKPQNEGEACMQECIVKGCGEFDFTCQNGNMEKCEEECNMKGDAPDESTMSNEQLCITHCVAEVDPSIICGASKEGETGNAVCQKCANECVSLYEGPCLNDEEIKSKQKECQTCEHCYGEPVMGDSGEGWECIVDVSCEDASSDFGDQPGEGPGIGQEGYVAPNVIAGAVDGVIKFFKEIFTNEE